jgi:Spy/CpxP family protein refolding chaperone
MKKLVLFTAAIFLSFSILSAQQGRSDNRRQNLQVHHKLHMNALNLNDDQKENIKDLRLEFSKKTLNERNELRELSARYRTLTSGENLNLDAIDKNIEKRQALKTELMKQKARLNLEIRKLLTEEQRIKLDSRPHKGQGPKQMHSKGRRM